MMMKYDFFGGLFPCAQTFLTARQYHSICCLVWGHYPDKTVVP